MMNRHVEIKEEGMFTIQKVDDKLIVQQVARGWHVLFTDSVGNKRFGYVLKIDPEQRQFHVLDAIMYPNAPSPLGTESEIVSFDAVIIAQQGFNWLRDADIYGAGKKIGKRQVAIIIKGYERDADVGWLVRKGGRAYVDRQGDRWQLRSSD
jgi:hypothetical protein